MRKTVLIIGFIGLLLAGCQGSPPQAEEGKSTRQAPPSAAYSATTPTASATAGDIATRTQTPASTTTPNGKEPVSASSPGCTVRSPFPTPGPTEQSLFPPAGDKDWVTGPESAQITFTEYSDFQ
jgi:hypothetical protein